MNSISIGSAAGGSGDRVDVASAVVATLVNRGGPAALIFENLAERTLAFAQLAKRIDPESGYEPALVQQLQPILADCLRHGIPIIGNFGAANPKAAARRILQLSEALGLPPPRIAVIEGDDLANPEGKAVLEAHLPAQQQDRALVAANVYLGAFEIAEALQAGAQIVVAGRVADPSLVLGPAAAHFGWSKQDWNALAGATMAGHLLECGAQVSGGYFADPGFKDVPGLEAVGYPIAEIFADGSCVISKADHSGGLVSERTVKEQLLYEIHDPAAYITPDVVADLSAVTIVQDGADRVRVTGVTGHPRTPTLKALVYYEGGWLGEAEISYAGPNAEARARLAMELLRRRHADASPRFDLIGLVSVFGDDAGRMQEKLPPGSATEVRLRAALRHDDIAVIDRLLRDVESLPLNGPAGGGGVRTYKRRRLSNTACLIPREAIHPAFYFET